MIESALEMRLKKILRLVGVVVLAIFLLVGGLFLSAYLKTEKRFIYATGTNDKAFLNATWKMSPQEVQRANHTTLSQSGDEFTFLLAPEVMDKTRFKELIQKDVTLWGMPTEIRYSFFDDILYEYYIPITAYDPNKPIDEVLATIRSQFGAGTPDPKKDRPDLLHNLEWDSGIQKLSCWMIRNDDHKTFHIGIRATYKPFAKHIEDLATSEKKKYF